MCRAGVRQGVLHSENKEQRWKERLGYAWAELAGDAALGRAGVRRGVLHSKTKEQRWKERVGCACAGPTGGAAMGRAGVRQGTSICNDSEVKSPSVPSNSNVSSQRGFRDLLTTVDLCCLPRRESVT